MNRLGTSSSHRSRRNTRGRDDNERPLTGWGIEWYRPSTSRTMVPTEDANTLLAAAVSGIRDTDQAAWRSFKADMEAIPLKAEKVELWTTRRIRVARRPLTRKNTQTEKGEGIGTTIATSEMGIDYRGIFDGIGEQLLI